MKRIIISSFIFVTVFCYGQTDETIFREFRFDFSTPGARANALGKAFVGLADEATAAYNNPAGLAILEHPEISIEYRQSENGYSFLAPNNTFRHLFGDISQPVSNLNKISYASFSFSKFNTNFSFFYVNQLDYQRDTVSEQTDWYNEQEFYSFTYVNFYRAMMQLDTFGISFGKQFSKLSLGGAVGNSRYDFAYEYQTRTVSDDIGLTELVNSQAEGVKNEPTFVIGALYRIFPNFRVGMAYKKLPKFHFSEQVENLQHPESNSTPIIFKVPDTFSIGISYLPTERVTLLIDFNRIWYNQLAGNNFTVISGDQYNSDNFKIPSVTEHHLGLEYLLPYHSHIFAFRCGTYFNPDHKTRFKGDPNRYQHQIKGFVFNTGDKNDAWGYSFGIGYVFKNKIQLDFAYLKEEGQYKSFITSFLYRFGKQ